MTHKYNIAGIQQVGIGVENLYEAWKYYIELFQMDVRILEDNKVAALMLPYTGGKPQRRHAAIAVNMQGGGGFEVWQYSERKPQPLGFELQMGDLGVLVCKLRSRDVTSAFEAFSRNPKAKLVGGLNNNIDGSQTFYLQDPYGNLFEVVQDDYLFKDEGRLTGEVAGVTIGVTDIDRAMTVYHDILGYDTILADETGTFPDYAALPGGTEASAGSAGPPNSKGSFSELFGPSRIRAGAGTGPYPQTRFMRDATGVTPGFIQVSLTSATWKRSAMCLIGTSLHRGHHNSTGRAVHSIWVMQQVSSPTSKIRTAP